MSEASPTLIESFKNKARQWAQKVVALSAMQVPPDLEPKRQKLLATARTIKKWVEKIFGTMDELEINGLGLSPLIPIAAITAALSGITYWSLDYAKFLKTIEERKRLEGEGLTPQQAAAVMRESQGSGALININWKAAIPFALVGGAIYLFRSR